ncbi:MAG: hypothetical protein Q7S92_03195 [Candidatus Diapherotrites archaeon]|nr:hypothetical protein [Candidatus Diapherotrites archaeon]
MAKRKSSLQSHKNHGTLDQIKCPNCGTFIPITETLNHQLKEATRHELEKEFSTKFIQQKEKLEKDAIKKAEEEVSVEIKDYKKQLQEKNKKFQKKIFPRQFNGQEKSSLKPTSSLLIDYT